jgi:LPXTG-motif cell wall-anchored protein
MSVRARIISAFGAATVAVAIVAPAAGAAVQPPPGATVSDALQCRDGSPEWLVSMANSGPNATIDYTLQSDGGTKVDYIVPVGPLMQRLMPAKNGGSHLTVLADGVTMIDTTQTIEGCGEEVTTTTVPHPTPTTASHATPTTVKSAGQPVSGPTNAAPAANDPVTTAAAAKTLPFTGSSSSLPLGLFGTALVVAGVGAVFGSRRRSGS